MSNNNQDDYQYVEVDEKTNEQIQKAKQNKTNNNKANQNNQKQQKKQDKKELITPKPLIKDDREVIKPKYTQKDNQKQYQSKNQYQPKEQTHYVSKRTEQKKQNNERKKNYVQNVNYSQNNQHRKNYARDNFRVERIYPETKFKNHQIFIHSDGHFNQFMTKVKKLIHQYPKIALIADGINIVKAVTIAQQANNIFPNKLRRINIPGTIQIQEKYISLNSKQKSFSKFKKISTITIQLSLNYLEKRHMGYQDNIVESNYSRKDRKKFDGQNKKINYMEKKRNQGQYR